MDKGGLTKIGGLLILLGLVLALSPTIGTIVTTYEYVMYVFYIVIGCGVGLLASTQILEKEEVQIGEKYPSTAPAYPVPAPTTESSEKVEAKEEKEEGQG